MLGFVDTVEYRSIPRTSAVPFIVGKKKIRQFWNRNLVQPEKRKGPM